MAQSKLYMLFAVARFLTVVTAQTCYWPDGTATSQSDSTPCTSEFSANHLNTSNDLNTCCPQDWMCLSNGLCQNPSGIDSQTNSPDGLFGRYACTDPSFNGCAEVCKDTGPTGAEAVLQCSAGRFCCDRNRSSGNCCTGGISNTPQFFGLNNGQIVSPGGSSGGSSSVPPVTSSSSYEPPPTTSFQPSSSSASYSHLPPSSSPPPVSTSSIPTDSPTAESVSATSSSSPAQPTFSTSIRTDASGSRETIVVTATPTSSESSHDGSSSNLGLIVGCAVGIPLGLAAIGVVVFFLLRQRRRAPRAESPPFGPSRFTDDYKDGPNEQIYGAAGYRPSPGGLYEADGTAMTPHKPDGKNNGEVAELDSKSASPKRSPRTQYGTPVPPYDAKWSQAGEGGPHELPTEQH